ncbi:hypothetical protein [Desulfocurvibacter africanus]|uniref:hypothetical protein n=1 Tax=Desulfocurvibacter africanus TaxID=873 RepID=UPI000408F4B1|nr:hypothetical protein [Desulfocurvibacter africanus]
MEVDPLVRIYSHAEALRTLAEQLPEEQGGLALILNLLGDDLDRCGAELDDKWKPGKREAAAVKVEH